MREFRHFLIMMVLCPWIGGTIIGYSVYWNSKVTDFSSAIWYLFCAATVMLIFGLLITCIVHVTVACITYFPFMIINLMHTRKFYKVLWISIITFACAIIEGIALTNISHAVEASTLSIVSACIIAGAVGAWLNSLNWLPPIKNEDIQQVVDVNRP